MKNSLFLVFFALLFSNSTQAQQLEWIHPQPGGFPILEINFTSEQHGYAFNANGDLFETNNQGASWELKQHFPGKGTFQLSGKTGLIAGGSGDVYVSQNYGRDWEKIIFSANAAIEYSDLVNDSTFYLASSRNFIYRTTDSGKSWTTLNCKGNIRSVEFISVDTGWVGLSNTNILFTTDGGQTWTPQATSNVIPSNVPYMHFTNGTGYAFREHYYLLRTVDYGTTWVATDFHDEIFDMYFINEETGYACTEYGLIYKSTDSGISWQIISIDKARILNNDFKTIYFLNEEVGFAAGNRGRIFKTMDGGESWSAYSEPYYTLSDLSFATDSIFYTASGQTLYKSTNRGKNWTKIPLELYLPYANKTSIRNLHFFDEKNGMVVTDDDARIYSTSDGGITWEANPLTEVGGNYVFGLQFLSDSLGYLFPASDWATRVVRTEDGGKTWTKIWPPDGTGLSLRDIYFVNKEIGYGLRYNALYKTTTGGSSWEPVLEEEYGSLNGFDFVNDSVGFITGINTLLKKTKDGGKTWQQITLPFYDHLTAIKFLTEDIGIMHAEYGSLYFTYDGGLTWEQIARDKYHFTKIKIGPGNIFYLFGENGQLATFNPGGIRISSLNSNLNDRCILDVQAELHAILSTASDIQFEMELNGIHYSGPASLTEVSNQKTLLSGKIEAPFQPDSTYQWRLRYTSNGVIHYSAYQTLITPSRPSAPQIQQPVETSICEGDSSLVRTIGEDKLYWLLNEQPMGPLPSKEIWLKEAGTYQLYAMNNCFSSDTISIQLTTKVKPQIPEISELNGTLFSSATTGNQWYLNGTLLPGATGNTLKPDQNGIYQVREIAGNCASNLSEEFRFDLLTASKINSYPNPVTNQLNIRSTVGGPLQVQLLNATGTVLFNQSTTGTSMQIDMSGYLSGNYFIRVYFPTTGETVTKMIYKL
jgi:photosystem II stability/assembly factor-like uncharacterized protein